MTREPGDPRDWTPLEPMTEDHDWELWEAESDAEPHTLVELVNRVLDRGVVISGEITLSVAGVDLVYLGLNAMLTSVSTARRVLGSRAGHGVERDGGRESAE